MSHDVRPHAASPWHTLDSPALSLHIANHTDHDEAFAREVQYRPGMFDCTGKRQHGVRTMLAGKDKKNLNKRPKPLQQTLNKSRFLTKTRPFRSRKKGERP
jgi:hypothetical protein